MNIINNTKQLLEQIKADKLNSFVHIDDAWTLKMAEASQKRIDSGDPMPLEGWPISIKALFSIQGLPTSACSKILSGYNAPYTATAVQRLIDAGAILTGINNCDEFGMGSANVYSAYGACENPIRKNGQPTSPGGSSGGAAATVASGLSRVALGTDSGGSCRQPAAWTGIIGFKPTYGLISRHGVVAHASSLDTVGVIAQSVEDIANVLKCIAGFDFYDAQTYDQPVPDYVSLCMDKLGSCKIASADFGTEISWYSKLGDLDLTSVDISSIIEYVLEVYMIISTAEAASNLSRYDGIRYGRPTAVECADLQDYYAKTRSEGFGEEVRRRILTGTHVLMGGGHLFKRASQIRQYISDLMHQLIWSKYDALILPTTTMGAMTFDEVQIAKCNDMYLSDRCTVLASLIGSPAISIPVSRDHDGMPLGMQIVGPPFSEGKILQIAREIVGIVDYQ